MKRHVLVVTVFATLAGLSAAGLAWAETDAARLTAEKLARKGLVDGVKWSVDFKTKDTVRNIVEWLAETARGEPWEIRFVIDHQSIKRLSAEAKGEKRIESVEDKVPFNLTDVSIEEALQLVLGERLAYSVQDDGSVLISTTSTLESIAGTWPLRPDLPTKAAAETRRKLARSGSVDGVRWSVGLHFEDQPWGKVLQHIGDMAANEPHRVKVLIDTLVIESYVNLSRPLTLRARDVSLHQALSLSLGTDLRYLIKEDGTVVVAHRQHFSRLQGTVAQAEVSVDFHEKVSPWFSKSTQARLTGLIESPEVLGAAAEEVLGVPPERAKDLLYISWRAGPRGVRARTALSPTTRRGSSAPSLVTLQVGRGFPEVRPVAREILETTFRRFKEVLLAEHERELAARQESRAKLEQKLPKAREPLEELDGEIEKLAKQLEEMAREKTIPKDPSNEVRTLEGELEKVEMDVEVKKARQRALVERIAAIREEVAKRLKTDAISAELRRVVGVREEQLQLIKKQEGSALVSTDTRLEAEVKLAEARARLAERREVVSQSVGGAELLTRLNAELAMLAVDRAEVEARFQLYWRRLRRARDVLSVTKKRGELVKSRKYREARASNLQIELATIEDVLQNATPPTLEWKFR